MPEGVYKNGKAKGHPWFFKVYVGRDARGRERVIWKRGFRTEKEAARARRELLRSLERGEYVPPSRRSLAEFLEKDWLPSIRAELAPSTWDACAGHVARATWFPAWERCSSNSCGPSTSELGVHAKVVAERLGHATVTMTLHRYSHAIPAMQESAADLAARLLDPPGLQNGLQDDEEEQE